MSLIPYFFPMERQLRRYWDCDDFGLGITPREMEQFFEFPESRLNSRLRSAAASELSSVFGKDGFQANIDVQQFNPNEITVKTTDDNEVIVEGKHEERKDDSGYVSRHFVRRYALPSDYNVENVTSTLSSDGILTVKAAAPQKAIKGNERVVQVQQTGPAHLNIKENSSEKTGKPKK